MEHRVGRQANDPIPAYAAARPNHRMHLPAVAQRGEGEGLLGGQPNDSRSSGRLSTPTRAGGAVPIDRAPGG